MLIYCCCITRFFVLDDCSFDLKTLSLESVEILTRMLPNEQEVKLLKDYEKDRKPIEVLADEDKFMLNVSTDQCDSFVSIT
jgi:hypothetical protein